MWNWKYLYEDNEFVCYCDIDNIINPEADEDGIYLSVDCYRSIPTKTATWMMYFIKNKETANRYIDYRRGASLPINGYEDFNNVICIVELDAEKHKYRVIPAGDFNKDGEELGVSTIIADAKTSFLKGMKANWSTISKGRTHKSIFALFRFIYGPGGSELE